MEYSVRFLTMFGRLMIKEGFISDNANDRGGYTFAGIAKNAWPDWRGWALLTKSKDPRNDVELWDAVKEFYYENFWSKIRGEDIGDALAWELLDYGVNSGVAFGIEELQRILNAHNKGGSLWENLPVGGLFGTRTWNAMQAMLRQGYSEEHLALMVNALQFAHYVHLTELTPSQKTFMNGWSKQRFLDTITTK